MAYHDVDGVSADHGASSGAHGSVLHLDGTGTAQLPDASYVRDAVMTRDGADLHLDGPNGSITVEGYFAAEDAPVLMAPDGSALSPALVNSFLHSPAQYAQNATASDESPVGAVQELTGSATVTHVDGTSEPAHIGTPIFQGDVIETAGDGAVNVKFIDDTTFAVSEDSRLAIDEFVYDPATQSGTQDFSVLKGMFVFTSGLIGRDDPDDVKIETPTGSIGIRGTIIAGNSNTGETTLIEGAIVVRDLAGNETTLDQQFETARVTPGQGIQNIGQLPATEVAARFSSVSNVSPTLFSSINDAAAEQGPAAPAEGESTQGEQGDGASAPADTQGEAPADAPSETSGQPAPGEARPNAPADANGSVDQNGDSRVDGTLMNNNGPADGMPATMGAGPTGPAGAFAPQPNVMPAMMQGGFGMDAMGGPAMGMARSAAAAMMASGGVDSPAAMGGGMMGAGMGGGMMGAMAGMMNAATDLMNPAGTAAGSLIAPVAGGLLGTAPLSNFLATNFAAPLTNGFNPILAPVVQPPTSFINPPPTVTATQNLAPIHIMSFPATGSVTIDGKTYNGTQLRAESNIAPNAYFFKAIEGSTWSIDFSEEFVDPENLYGTVRYQLDAATINLLNSRESDGGTAGSNIDTFTSGAGTGYKTADGSILAGTAGNGWSFDASTGKLDLLLYDSMTIDDTFDIHVRAIDAQDNASDFASYTFSALEQATVTSGYRGNDNSNIFNIGLFGNETNIKAYGGDDIDTFNIGNADNNNTVTESIFNLGISNNQATIDADAYNNVILGGNKNDTITVGNAQNEIFAMGGDDRFIFDISNTNLTYQLTGSGTSNAAITGVIDAGTSDFKAGTTLATFIPGYKHFDVTDTGYGDTLVLKSTSAAKSLDFTKINDAYFKGIERLELANTSGLNVTLSYTDVIEMTDYKNTLIISGDDDTINFDSQGHVFEKINNVNIEDKNASGTGSETTNFDVYTDGIVTLLIEDVPGNTNAIYGLPA